jgi:hypothetical protein
MTNVGWPVDAYVDVFWLNNQVTMLFLFFQIAHEHGIPFLETSAKSNINVEKAFMDLAQAILNKVCCIHMRICICSVLFTVMAAR